MNDLVSAEVAETEDKIQAQLEQLVTAKRLADAREMRFQGKETFGVGGFSYNFETFVMLPAERRTMMEIEDNRDMMNEAKYTKINLDHLNAPRHKN